MKRLRADRPNWPRILRRHFSMTAVDAPDFSGYITLIQFEKVREPLLKSFAGTAVCLVDDGYAWLQQFPRQAHHSVTTMFDAQGEVVQWYIDVCLRQGLDADGVPWVEDLYLDIVVMPSGECLLYDEDELEAALAQGEISTADYDLAWREARRILAFVEKGEFELLLLAQEHYRLLAESSRSHK